MPVGASDGVIPPWSSIRVWTLRFLPIMWLHLLNVRDHSDHGVTRDVYCGVSNKPHSETVTFESEGTRSHARKGWNVTGHVMSLTRSVGDCRPRSEINQSLSVEEKTSDSVSSLCTHNFQVRTIEKCLCDLSFAFAFQILSRTFQELQDG